MVCSLFPPFLPHLKATYITETFGDDSCFSSGREPIIKPPAPSERSGSPDIRHRALAWGTCSPSSIPPPLSPVALRSSSAHLARDGQASTPQRGTTRSSGGGSWSISNALRKGCRYDPDDLEQC